MKTLLVSFTILTIIISTYSYNLSREQQLQKIGLTNTTIPHQVIRLLSQQPVQYAIDIPALQYASLFVYLLGMRIPGMDNLLIWQLVQLFDTQRHNQNTETQLLYFQIGEYIHGYTNPNLFAFESVGFGVLFSKLNFFWEMCVALFLIAVLVKHVVAPWYKNKLLELKNKEQEHIKNMVIQVSPYVLVTKTTQGNQVQVNQQNPTLKLVPDFEKPTGNRHDQSSESTIKFGSKMSRANQTVKNNALQSVQSSGLKLVCVSNLQTVQESNLNSHVKDSKCLIKRKQVTQHNLIHSEFQERIPQTNIKPLRKRSLGKGYLNYKRLILCSNTIFKQVILHVLLNSLPVICYSLVKEIRTSHLAESSSTYISFSACIIALSSFIMLMYIVRLVLERGSGSGQTKTKFANFTYANKLYWSTVISQRIIYSIAVASGWEYAIALIGCLKLAFLIFSKFLNVWSNSYDYYRYLISNFIHLLILLLLNLDVYYFSNTNKIKLSKTSIAYILLSLLLTSLIFNFVFILKDTGIFSWITNKLKIKPKVAIQSYTKNQPIPNHTLNHTSKIKHVKFKQTNPNSKIVLQTKQSNVKSANKQQNLSIKPDLTIQQTKTSQSLVKKQQSEIKGKSSFSKPNLTKEDTNSRSKSQQIWSQKRISKVIDDALRAEKTHKIIIEETKQGEEVSQQEDMVSIRLEQVLKRQSD